MMEKATRIVELFARSEAFVGQTARVQGWVRTRRDSKAGISFIELNDGSCLRSVQIIAEHNRQEYQAVLAHITTGSCILVEGTVTPSPGKGQPIEVLANRIDLYGPSDPLTYPLQKKRHSLEFLRQIAHLRPRSNTIGAVTRIRNRLSYAVHQFFQDRGFYYIHTPIITSSDCEGAGEVFRVTTLGPESLVSTRLDRPFENDFFGKPAFLTVSGQLQAEIYALALGKVYTFGPTFRS
ncbi:MAG TPA: OB-fold nucleic acid binding domain-containing protein, partial [Syntrophobacteraceae bacterium]|nr:OB-fold nucleic acid binding domain-containing protein [Syntrophobacteraceae bacterium]